MAAPGKGHIFKLTIWFKLHAIKFIDLKLSRNRYNINLKHIPAKSQGAFKINLMAILNIRPVSIININ